MIKRHLDFELSIEPENRDRNQYVARVIKAPIEARPVSITLPDLKGYRLSNVQVEQLQGRSRNAVPVEIDPQKVSLFEHPEEFGAALFDTLLHDEIKECWRANLAYANQNKYALRFCLRLERAPELESWPWEYLFDRRKGEFLFLSEETSLVRRFVLDGTVPSLEATAPLHILVVVANPLQQAALDVQQEWKTLREKWSDPNSTQRVVLELLKKPTIDCLADRLRQQPSVHILHFIGHGTFDANSNPKTGYLVWENEEGTPDFVDDKRLRLLFRDHPALRFIFLNACEGARTDSSTAFAGVAQQLISLGMPAVIAMQFPIPDRSAIHLAEKFYQTLAIGESVDCALAIARKALYTEARKATQAHGNHTIAWGTPVLFLRASDGFIVPPPCPYPGMTPFTVKNSVFFCGRQKEIKRLLERIDHQRELFVIGPSGSGKSSLIYAGLIPTLQRDQKITWQIRQFRPGDNPIAALQEQSKDLFIPASHELQAVQYAPAPLKADRLLLFVDQLEELFTQSDGQTQQAFIAELNRVRALEQVTLIFTLRADFLPELMNCQGFVTMERFAPEYIFPLDKDGLRAAICEPAAALAVEVESGLVEQLLSDAADQKNVMPLLQETLRLLWQKQRQRTLSLDTYTTLVPGNESGLRGVLKRKADELYELVEDANSTSAEGRSLRLFLQAHKTEYQRVVRRIFLRLVRSDEHELRYTRRQQTPESLGAVTNDATLFDATLNYLIDSRLLTTDIDEETKKIRHVDLAHEAIIECWDKLKGWLTIKKGEAGLALHRFEQMAENWDSRKQGKTGLLDESEFKELQRWWQNKEIVIDTGVRVDLLTTFIEASKKEIEQRRRIRNLFITGICTAIIVTTVAALYARYQAAYASNQRNQTLQQASILFANRAREQLLIDPVAAIHFSEHALPSSADRRPFAAAAEFTLIHGIHSSLERQYFLVTVDALTANQVAVGANRVAVGGAALQLLDRQLQQPVSLYKQPSEEITNVAWNDHDLLLSYSYQHAMIWRGQQVLAEEWFADPIKFARWQPTGDALTIGVNNDLQLWAPPAHRESLATFSSPVQNAAWSKTGAQLAAWDTNRTLRAWEMTQLKPSLLLSITQPSYIGQAAWSPTGRQLATVSNDGQLHIFNVTEQPSVITATISSPQGSNGRASVLFLDDERVAAWLFNGQLHFFDQTGRLLNSASAADATQQVQLAPDGQHLLAFLRDGSLVLWSVGDAITEQIRFKGHQEAVIAADWFEDYLVTASGDGSARVWDLTTGDEIVALYGHTADKNDYQEVLGVRWVTDQSDLPPHLLTWGRDNSVRRWQVFDAQGTPLCDGVDQEGLPRCYDENATFTQHDAEITTMRWLNDETLVTTSKGSEAGHWSTGTNHLRVWQPVLEQQQIISQTKAPAVAVWDPTGQAVLTYVVGQNGIVRHQIIGQPSNVITLPMPIMAAVWITRGLLISTTGHALLVDPVTGAAVATWQNECANVVAAAEEQRGQIALVTKDQLLCLWDQAQPAPQQLTNGATDQQPSPIAGFQWSKDGKRLLTFGAQVQLWDLDTHSSQAVTPLTKEKVQAAFSPDEQLIAVAITETVTVLNVSDGKLRWHSDLVHQGKIAGIAWIEGQTWPNQPDSSLTTQRALLLTWSRDDRTARLWDWQQGVEVMRMAERNLVAVAISPSGGQIATASQYFRRSCEQPPCDVNVIHRWRVWPTDPAALLRKAQTYKTRELSRQQLATFLLPTPTP